MKQHPALRRRFEEERPLPPVAGLEEEGDEDEEDDEEKPATPEDRGPDEAKMMERFLKARAILISEPITSALARRIFQNLILLEAESAEKPITVVINSPGGEADTGFGIYDMMRFVKPPVRTIVAGLCASAAVMVYLAAEKEDRLSLPNSRFLLHQPSSASFGQASDLEIAAREILKLRDRYNEIVAKETGKTIEQVTEDADRDFWMSAEEARVYGLVTKVVTRRSELD